MTDLCWTCQQNSTALMRSANTPEEEKSEVETDLQLKKKALNHHLFYFQCYSEISEHCVSVWPF